MLMNNVQNWEAKLQKLIEIGATHNLTGVREYQLKGGRIVGLMPAHIPEEILSAFRGILPWHVVGTMNEATPLADVHRSPATDAYTTHVLDALLSGELSFLDSLVTTNYDDDIKSLQYLSTFYKKPNTTFWLEIPTNASEVAVDHFAEKFANMKRAVAEHIGVDDMPTGEAIGEAIRQYNTSRKLLHELYELRKREHPPLCGSEICAIVSAAMSMPQEDFIQQLEALLPYIENRQPLYSNPRPRIMISSDFLHSLKYLKIIEDVGGVIAMDDLDVGARYFWEFVDEDETEYLHALARRYLEPMSSPRFVNWDGQVDLIVEWIKEFKIDGFVELPVRQSFSRLFRSEYLHKTLEEEGIPSICIQREYHFSDAAQIATRVEAFIEMLSTTI